ncbi:MAG: Gfo/Idh/MocA family oxidoreductase [Deltaproteobacteria bacterium]
MKKTRIAVIGAGYLGRLHAQKCSRIPEAHLVGVVDIARDRAEEVAKEANSVPYTDFRRLFGAVDAVSIVTPTENHFEIGLEFLKAGVDVLMEKPVTKTPEEALRLIEEAGKRGLILQVGHLERFNAAVVALEGRVNNPMFIESQRISPFPNRSTDVDVILDLMIHDIDIILNLVRSDVKSVSAVGMPVVTDMVDMANARITFANGCVADVTASRVARERVRKITIFQREQYFSIDYANQLITASRPRPDAAGLHDEEIRLEKSDSLMEEIRAFIKCSATRTPPLVSGAEGLNALKLAQRIQEAAKASMEEFLLKCGHG